MGFEVWAQHGDVFLPDDQFEVHPCGFEVSVSGVEDEGLEGGERGCGGVGGVVGGTEA